MPLVCCSFKKIISILLTYDTMYFYNSLAVLKQFTITNRNSSFEYSKYPSFKLYRMNIEFCLKRKGSHFNK